MLQLDVSLARCSQQPIFGILATKPWAVSDKTLDSRTRTTTLSLFEASALPRAFPAKASCAPVLAALY